MNLCVVFSLLVLVAGSLAAPNNQRNDARVLYEQFKREYNKETSNDEDDMRFGIFRNNLKRMDQLQAEEQGTAEYGITEFSDLTEAEFASIYTNSKMPFRDEDNQEEEDDITLEDLPEAPASVDWRLKGAVGPVLDQGMCGSCWAFSVVGNIESQWFRKTGQLLQLSKQQLVDCDIRDHGCRGGYPSITYEEVRRLRGLMLESQYPYIGREQKCQLDRKKIVAYVNDSKYVKPDEELQAAYLAANGPLSTCLNAKPLQFYKRGIVHPWWWNCLSTGMNHAVLTVGYGVENGKPYWLVKNSWSERWGEQGYFRIKRGSGTCGINRLVTSAIIR